jgi:outer membrane protein
MIKLVPLVCTLAAIFFMSATVQAQKVGTVDMNKVFSSYYKTKEAETRINEARAAAKKELDERMESYKKNMDSINKLNDEIAKTELSAEAKEQKGKQRDQMIAETKTLEREINEFRSTREKQLQEQAVRMRNSIVEEIQSLIKDRIKTDNFDLVLDRSGQSLNGVPVVLYSRDTMDFSDDIIVTLNKNKPAAAAAGTPAGTPAKAPAKPLR